MENDINSQVEKIHEGITNLKRRTNFNILRLHERLWEIEHAVNDYRKRNSMDSINHMLEIFKETGSASPEGAIAYNESIWNANIEVSGKQITLGKLFDELREFVENYRTKKERCGE